MVMRLQILAVIVAILLYWPARADAQSGEVLIDATKGGVQARLFSPSSVATDLFGNTYLGNGFHPVVLKIDAQGAISEAFNQDRAPLGVNMGGVEGLAVDSAGNLYVAGRAPNPSFDGGAGFGGVFKVTPSGVTSVVISPNHQGFLSRYYSPQSVFVDNQDSVYVAASESATFSFQVSGSVVKMTSTGQVSLLLDGVDRVSGNTIGGPSDIVVDSRGVISVVGDSSNNVLQIHPNGSVVEVIDESGDGNENQLKRPERIAVDSQDNIFVVGVNSSNVFRITPSGQISLLLDSDGNNEGDRLSRPADLVVDSRDNVYVSAQSSTNIFQISPRGAVHEMFDYRHIRGNPYRLAIDTNDNLIVMDLGSRAIRFQTDNILTEHSPIFTNSVLHLPAIYLTEDGSLHSAKLQYSDIAEPGFNLISAEPVVGAARLPNTPVYYDFGRLVVDDVEVGSSIYSLLLRQNVARDEPQFYVESLSKIK